MLLYAHSWSALLTATTSSPWHWTGGKPDLNKVATSMSKAESEALPALDELLQRLEEAQRRLHANSQHAVLLILQGLDASGKDSLLRTLAQGLDPAGFRACSFGRPNSEEIKHDYLWRVVRQLPAHGQVVAFNRSHYEAVLAERQLPDASPKAAFWAARCGTISAFEQHLSDSGTHIIKVWLHQSREVQRDRLLKRLDEPRKRWKFDPSDVDTFANRGAYLSAFEDAVRDTHSESAPWYLIPADSKSDARRAVAQILLQALEALAPDYPPSDAEVDACYRKLLG